MNVNVDALNAIQGLGNFVLLSLGLLIASLIVAGLVNATISRVRR